jgi:hypothetical protein
VENFTQIVTAHVAKKRRHADTCLTA